MWCLTADVSLDVAWFDGSAGERRMRAAGCVGVQSVVAVTTLPRTESLAAAGQAVATPAEVTSRRAFSLGRVTARARMEGGRLWCPLASVADCVHGSTASPKCNGRCLCLRVGADDAAAPNKSRHWATGGATVTSPQTETCRQSC